MSSFVAPAEKRIETKRVFTGAILVFESRLASTHPSAEFILSLSKGFRALSRRYPLNAYVESCGLRVKGFVADTFEPSTSNLQLVPPPGAGGREGRPAHLGTTGGYEIGRQTGTEVVRKDPVRRKGPLRRFGSDFQVARSSPSQNRSIAKAMRNLRKGGRTRTSGDANVFRS
ncbi:MAG: hypothetical protein MAG451_01508 [Anaerolineales bacterium]|nr:hypothetical protein [Anaerolineales bacterium]